MTALGVGREVYLCGGRALTPPQPSAKNNASPVSAVAQVRRAPVERPLKRPQTGCFIAAAPPMGPPESLGRKPRVYAALAVPPPSREWFKDVKLRSKGT